MKRMFPVGVLAALGLTLTVIFACAQQKPLRATADSGARTATEIVTHPEVDFSMGCVECHTTMTPDVVSRWQGSLHGKANVKCYVCHGDAREEFHAAGDAARCTGCHAGKAVDFTARPEHNCFDCHNGHTLVFHAGD